MKLGTYIVTVKVSALYFIASDGRIKYFREGVDFSGHYPDGCEPLGLVRVECSETSRYVIQAFRLRLGFDVEELLKLASQPGLLGRSPAQLILGQEMQGFLAVADRKRLKKDCGLESIVFTRIDSDGAPDLALYDFDSSYLDFSRSTDVPGFIRSVNIAEVRSAIVRTISEVSESKVESRLSDLRRVGVYLLTLPPSEWRTPHGLAKPDYSSQCAVIGRDGLIDECRVISRRASQGPSFEDVFGEMFDEDDDLDCEEDGGSDDVDASDISDLILAISMMSCSGVGWPELGIDVDDLLDALEEEDVIDADVYEDLQGLINSNSIFLQCDTHNAAWPAMHAYESSGTPFYFDLVSPGNTAEKDHFVVIIYESGLIHLCVLGGKYYSRDGLDENLDLMFELEIERVKIKSKTHTLIKQLVDMGTSPESMEAACVLLKTLLHREVPVIAALLESLDLASPDVPWKGLG